MDNGYDRPFGKPDGLGKRLAMWANSLARDRQYPWMGSGLVDDLICAAEQLGEDPRTLYPGIFAKKATETNQQEYDL